ncbi:sodium:proton antiporter [Salinimicrobium marinum]|uniref:Sodium:proton antiporter n=1 Tax=Salinimicrobium marinum TaxID=680283 RepID=A0A918VW52_9FLAO|nr:Na+/H+ antiporter NhaC family protein [Salinimicrobium marinum]GHA35245.1 sodium:proton antiporter [Salinimicrobium marinum]
MSETSSSSKGSFIALLPLVLFVATFLGAGIYLNDFYAFPSPIAVTLGIILAFCLFKDPIEAKVSTFLKGCGDEKIMTMCLIYLLAGAFTVVSKATGSVDAIVDLGINYISLPFLYAGIFIISAFLSFSTGTSVGAIVALVAIVISLAEKTGASLPVLSASLLGGAMFGDNLSFISDTTIAATQTLGCKMKDKFRQNLKVALPAALLTIMVLIFQGFLLNDQAIEFSSTEVELVKIIPYLLVISLAIAGLNVFVVLMIGIFSAGIIGIINNNFSWLGFAKLGYEGFEGMTEIFLLSLLTGGLAAMVAKAGGLNYITRIITGKINKKSAYLGIGGLVGMTNITIANNTVSILVTGNIAKELRSQMKLKKVKVASVLDIFACVVQGILPYGAQVLLLLSYAEGKMDYRELIGNAWYIWFLLAGTIVYFGEFKKMNHLKKNRTLKRIQVKQAA